MVVDICVQITAIIQVLVKLDVGVLVKILVQIVAAIPMLIKVNASVLLNVFGIVL